MKCERIRMKEKGWGKTFFSGTEKSIRVKWKKNHFLALLLNINFIFDAVVEWFDYFWKIKIIYIIDIDYICKIDVIS